LILIFYYFFLIIIFNLNTIEIYSDSNYVVIRRLANHLKFTGPTFIPIVQPTEQEKQEANNLAKTNGIDFITSMDSSKDQTKGYQFITIED